MLLSRPARGGGAVLMDYVKDLVIDVGMHNGDDTAYYLHKGYRVVAIEANPQLVERGHARFSAALRDGRLTIVPIGIAAERGQAEFYIAPGNLDVLSSFNRDMVERAASNLVKVQVECLPFRDVLATHGVPHYLKVDIEGNDSLCLAGLDARQLPAFVSIELDMQYGERDLETLRALGYSGFKCIRQNDLYEVSPARLAGELAWRRRAAASGPIGLANRVLRGLRHRAHRRAQNRRAGHWRFLPGSSGAFGDDLAGDWQRSDQLLDIWRQLAAIHHQLAAGWRSEWFDLHARLEPVRGSLRR